MSKLSLEKNQDDQTPLEIGADWVKNFVNDLGGDFSIIEDDGTRIILQNESSCPGLCLGKQDQTTCNEIEKTINDGVRYFDSHFTAGFVKCSHNRGAGCELVVSFNP